MANYDLETETTVHVKGMSLGGGSDIGEGNGLTAYRWPETGGSYKFAIYDTAANVKFMVDKYAIYGKGVISLFLDGEDIAGVYAIYYNTFDRENIPADAEEFHPSQITINVVPLPM